MYNGFSVISDIYDREPEIRESWYMSMDVKLPYFPEVIQEYDQETMRRGEQELRRVLVRFAKELQIENGGDGRHLG